MLTDGRTTDGRRCAVSCCVVMLKAHEPRRYVKLRSDDKIRVVSDVHSACISFVSRRFLYYFTNIPVQYMSLFIYSGMLFLPRHSLNIIKSC